MTDKQPAACGPRALATTRRSGSTDRISAQAVAVQLKAVGHELFCAGANKAIEHAVRMARLQNGRPKVLAAYGS